MKLLMHHFLPFSFANGPGCRTVFWLQGCPLRCRGCFNPQTHGANQGEWVSIDDLLCRIAAAASRVQGITISGGEPLRQRSALTGLLRRVKRETSLSVVLFTGYTWAEILDMAVPHQGQETSQADLGQPYAAASTAGNFESRGLPEFLRYVDVLIAGRYVESLRIARGLQGSANKTFHFLSGRYLPADFIAVPEAEVIIESDGSLIQSGIAPPQSKPASEGQRLGDYHE